MTRFVFALSRRVVCLLCPFLCAVSSTLHAQTVSALRINEVMAANVDRFYDPSGNYGGWIEIYNPTIKELNLQNLWVSDDPQKPKKLRIAHSTPVPAKGFAVLWFDHYDGVFAPNQLNMKLDAEGGAICLSTSVGRVIHSVSYPPATPRSSYLCQPDGGTSWTLAANPTPGASNDTVIGCSQRLPAPEVSHPSQIFTRSFKIGVEVPEGCTLRYTTDGSTPTLINGYTATSDSFTVARTRVFRFALFREGCLSSPVVTRSYIKRDKQFTLPVLSLVTDPDHLYGSTTGVFVKGSNGRRGKGTSDRCNWNMDWDRPVNVELFDPVSGSECLNIEADLSRCGGHSKGFTPMSFKVKASKVYEGRNYLNYQFFSDRPYLKHKALQIRCGGNDYLCRIQDAALQSIVRESGIDMDLQNYQPICHYINGNYMGTINMREPNNKHNVYANHGLDDDEIDLFEIDCDSCYVQMCGTGDAWQKLRKLSAQAADPEVYSQIEQLLDIDECCNYMAVEMYLGNTDWPQNNCKGWRPIAENGKFRFILFDLDLTFYHTDPFSVFESRQWYTFCELFDVPGVKHYTREVELVPIFLGLLKNENFRKRFTDTFCLVAGSVFLPDRCKALIDQYVRRVEDMQLISSGYSGRNVSPRSTADELINKLSHRPSALYSSLERYSRLSIWSSSRQEVTLSANIPSAVIEVNGQKVPQCYFEGQLYAPVQLTAGAPRGYRFVGWKVLDAAKLTLDNTIVVNANAGDVVSTSPSLSIPRCVTGYRLQACFEREDKPGLPQVFINEVSAGNSVFVNEYFKKNDWVELYNPTDHDIDLAGMYLSDDVSMPQKYRIPLATEDLSTILPANGYRVVWCDKQEAQTQLHASFKLDNADGQLVMLTASDNSWADTLAYCAHDGMQSVGRYPDGSDSVYLFYRPTIGAPNHAGYYAERIHVVPLLPGGDPSAIQLAASPQSQSHDGGLGLALRGHSLHISDETHGSATLCVYNLQGQQVMLTNLDLSQGSASVSLLVLSPGPYIATLSAPDSRQCRVKVVTSFR